MNFRSLPGLGLTVCTIAVLSSCSEDVTSPNDQGPPVGSSQTLYGSTDLDSLVIAANDTLVVYRTSSEIPILRVKEDARIDGVLRARHSGLTLLVDGELKVSGEIDAATSVSSSGGSQFYGVSVVAREGLTVTRGARWSITGDLLVTDRESDLDLDREDLTAVATGVDSEMVPIVFIGGGVTADPTDSTTAATLAGTWTVTGDTRRTSIFAVRLHRAHQLRIGDWSVDVPDGPSPPPLSDDGPGIEAEAGSAGCDVIIDVPEGSIVLDGQVTIALGSGGRGGDVEKTGQINKVVAGAGGRPGGLVVRAGGSIEIGSTYEEFRVDPGHGGDGGDARVGTGEVYPITNVDTGQGYPRDHEARGGDGGDAAIRLRIEGATSGLEGLRVGPIVAGRGGSAMALGESAGPAPDVIAEFAPDGTQAIPGGAGSDVHAQGGDGGQAHLELVGVNSVGTTELHGGAGGHAEAIAGNGNDAGCLPYFRGAPGGNGGSASARGGAGGDATVEPEFPIAREAGSGGNARSIAGNGGNGGDSAIVPGPAGKAGENMAVAGLGGRGVVTAVSGTTVAEPGEAGVEGRLFTLRTARLAFEDLADVDGPLDDITHTVRVLNDQGDELGTCELDFPDFWHDDLSYIRWDPERAVLVLHYEFYAWNNRVPPRITVRMDGVSDGVLDRDFTGLVVFPHDVYRDVGAPLPFLSVNGYNRSGAACWECGQGLFLEGEEIPRNALYSVDPVGALITFRRPGGGDLVAMQIRVGGRILAEYQGVTVELLAVKLVLGMEEF